MNFQQIKKYRFEWARVKAVLATRGMSEAEMEAKRHELHVEALGADKSSTLFSDKEMDDVLGKFREISSADDMTGQIELGDMAASRKRHGVRLLLIALEKDDSYAEHWISRRQKAGRMLTVQGPAATLDTIGVADLEPLYIDLKKACRRRWARKGDLLTEIRVIRMERDLDEETTKEAIRKALELPVLRQLEAMDYEALLVVISTLRRTYSEDVPF